MPRQVGYCIIRSPLHYYSITDWFIIHPYGRPKQKHACHVPSSPCVDPAQLRRGRERKKEKERERGEGRKREGEREREGRRSDAPQVSAHSRGRACANAGGTKHDVRTVVSLSSRRMESLESYPTLSALPPLSPSEMPACKHVRKGVPSNKKTKVPITQTAQQILH